MVAVAILASSSGSLARERAAKRLQLAMVRPARYSAIALGSILAHVAAGAFVMAVACATLALQVDLSATCSHVLRPILPPAREEAKAMYELYMADTNTPVAVFALLAAFGTLLSAGLGRPVAVFVAFVALAVSEMSPSVVEQYPDELETNPIDKAGLAIARFAADFTRPVSSLSPIGKLAKDECVERSEVVRILLADLVTLPVVMSLLAALAMAHKQEDV